MSDETNIPDVEKVLPALERIAKTCSPEFQVACFETLLRSWLIGRSFGNGPSGNGGKATDKGIDDVSLEHKSVLSIFMDAHGVSIEKLGKSIDIRTGRIIAGKLSSSKTSERQRALAGLLALSHLVTDGSLRIPKEELRELCKKYAAEDSKHFNENVGGLEINGSLVFTPESDGWSVTVPGEDYLVRIIEANSNGVGEKSG